MHNVQQFTMLLLIQEFIFALFALAVFLYLAVFLCVENANFTKKAFQNDDIIDTGFEEVIIIFTHRI